jgi:hypothetical protein
MDCNFEEKTYEYYMNRALEHVVGQNNLFPPGQLLEGVVGFDAMAYSDEYPFWVLFSPKRGIVTSTDLWGNNPEILRQKDKLPEFLVNLFLQYKRPEFISKWNGRDFKYWKKPHFRYYIDQDQQDILFRLENKTKETAVVVYSAPAFYKKDDLFNYYRNNTIIQQSNFTEPHTMQNHKRYTYITAGGGGAAFSESTRIEPLNIREKIIRTYEKRRKFDNNILFINHIYKLVVDIMKETESDLNIIFNNLLEYRYSDSEIINELYIIKNFLTLTNLSWNILYKKIDCTTKSYS